MVLALTLFLNMWLPKHKTTQNFSFFQKVQSPSLSPPCHKVKSHKISLSECHICSHSLFISLRKKRKNITSLSFSLKKSSLSTSPLSLSQKLSPLQSSEELLHNFFRYQPSLWYRSLSWSLALEDLTPEENKNDNVIKTSKQSFTA